MPRRTLWLILAAIVLSMVCYERADRNPYGRWLAQAIDTIDHHYLEPLPEGSLFQSALDGIASKLDRYSGFLSRNESKDFQESLDQQFGGIGVRISLEGSEDRLIVDAPMPGTPAFKAGLQAGDQIVSIDSVATHELKLDEIVHRLRGKPGTPVTIRVLRLGQEEPIEFNLVRAVIRTDSVLGDIRLPDGSWNYFLPGGERIGYVRIVGFGESTFREVEAALKWLADRNCRGAVLDLRNNPGGLLPAAEQICNLFIPEGALIVSTRGRDAIAPKAYLADGRGKYQRLPLVVLVNGRSASASEIVAACLQDHGRATIVGERTWGKGSVQNMIPLEGGKSLLKLTVATYWRPSGKNIHRMTTSSETDDWGVRPDEGFSMPLDEREQRALIETRSRRDAYSRADSTKPSIDVQSDESSNSSSDSANAAAPASRSAISFDPQLELALIALRERME